MADIQDPPPAELLLYLETYKVVVCTQCKYAVQPNAIARHLKEIHHIHRGRRRPFMQHVSRLALNPAKDVINQEVIYFPVPSLPILDGLQCSYPECSHLCASEKRMKSHWAQDHGRAGYSKLDWHAVPIQTFFRGNLLNYFTNGTGHLTKGEIPRPRNLGNKLKVEEGFKELDEVDNAILQHYLSSTFKYLIAGVELQHVWRKVVPRLACHYSFLMHAILACTGLHIAATASHDRTDHMVRAVAHMDTAIPLFRSAILSKGRDSYKAVLPFMHFLVLYSIACDDQDGLLFVDTRGNETLPLWMHLLRNGCAALGDMLETFLQSPLRPLLDAWSAPDLPAGVGEMQLTQLLMSAIPLQSSGDCWSDAVCEVYEAAAIQLAAAFWYTETLDGWTTWDALRLWPKGLSDDYLELLKAEHPASLILLANYCVLLRKLDNLWFFQGRASRLLCNVKKRLDPKWYHFIT